MIRNEVLDCIHARRSTRRFEDRPVEQGKLEAILDAAIWAPSGGGGQHWLFTAIRNKDIINKIHGLVVEGLRRWTPDDDYPGKLAAKSLAEKEGHNFFYNAPVLIIATSLPNYQNAMADCALALENIFLAAQSLGLGSCYINQLFWLRDDPHLREYLSELGIAKERVICSSAIVGYIAKESPAPPRKEGTIQIID